MNRRQFLGGALTAAVSGSSLTALSNLAAQSSAPGSKPPDFQRKIKLGVVGNGGRGSWIAKLFQSHGGYEMRAVADYFQEVADKCGDELGVDKARRFSTLSGYRKLIGHVRLQGAESAYSGEVTNLYEAGAVRNIADFYRRITGGSFENATVARAVDGVLTTILSREAAMRCVQLKMDEVIRENRRLELDLRGLKS